MAKLFDLGNIQSFSRLQYCDTVNSFIVFRRLPLKINLKLVKRFLHKRFMLFDSKKCELITWTKTAVLSHQTCSSNDQHVHSGLVLFARVNGKYAMLWPKQYCEKLKTCTWTSTMLHIKRSQNIFTSKDIEKAMVKKDFSGLYEWINDNLGLSSLASIKFILAYFNPLTTRAACNYSYKKTFQSSLKTFWFSYCYTVLEDK